MINHPAFRAGIRSAIEMAQIAAITLEVRPDASDMRQRAAVAALHGLVEGLKVAFIDPPAEAVAASPARPEAS